MQLLQQVLISSVVKNCMKNCMLILKKENAIIACDIVPVTRPLAIRTVHEAGWVFRGSVESSYSGILAS